MPNYEALSPELTKRIEDDKKNGTCPGFGFPDGNILRRRMTPSDRATLWRPAFVHDID